jgi:peptide/nickel transport system permease protein
MRFGRIDWSAQRTMAEFAYEPEPQITLALGESVQGVAGKSPWRLAGRRLLRNRVALAALVLFLLIVVVSFLAPVYAHDIAHTDPFTSNLSGTTVLNGKRVDVIQQVGGALGIGETPIGPTWHSNYFIGADNQGRDVMARVLYGGRASLEISIGSAVFCCVIALLLGLIAGFFGRVTDSVLSRLMDLIWAFPVYLLAISLATVLLTKPNGIQWGPIHVDPSSLWTPTVIIAIIFVPYVFRPVRGQVLSVREKAYVEAAIAQGASNLRLMFSEILPNVVSTMIVMLPLIIATTVLTESALSFLSIGVQPPKASWGTIINEGQYLLYTRPWVAIAPGIMIVLVVLALNILGDGVRDALDPRAKLRLKH